MAANLLMMFIIIMGIVSFIFIQRQMFPNIEINYINVRAAYPGASPQEIEESIRTSDVLNKSSGNFDETTICLSGWR